VSVKSFPDYKHLLQENYCTWDTIFFFKMQLKKFFYNTSVHFNMCSFCCTENVLSIISFSPRVLQHVFSYCSNTVCYSCLQICNIWNWCPKHFVLNIPPLKEVKGGDIRPSWWPGCRTISPNPPVWKCCIQKPNVTINTWHKI